MGVHTPIGPKYFKPDRRARRQRQPGLPKGWKSLSFAAGRRARYRQNVRAIMPYAGLSVVAFLALLAGMIAHDRYVAHAKRAAAPPSQNAWIVPKEQELPEDVNPPNLLEGGGPSLAGAPARNISATFSSCVTEGGRNCVVDGDTFWYQGTKIRIADIDTPETHPPRCGREARLGAAATQRLQTLLNTGSFRLEAIDRDTDRYGRKLRRVIRNGRSIGDTLIAEGLARPYVGGQRNGWCA